MTVKISSIGLKGLEGYRVQVEVQVSKGKESMVIVGLPDASVKESKERVLSTVRTQKCDVSDQKIVVNLSPSEQKKNAPFFDLAMALGILKEKGECKARSRKIRCLSVLCRLMERLKRSTGCCLL